MRGQLLTARMFALFFSRCRDRFALSFRFDFSAIDSWLQFKEFELFETLKLSLPAPYFLIKSKRRRSRKIRFSFSSRATFSSSC
jgi:hypothetical protein